MIGLDFIVNTVMDTEGNLVKVVAGDPVIAHTEGAGLSAGIYRTEIPRTADLYVLSSYPYDSDFYYASKSLENVGTMVQEHASVLMLSPCTGGWGNADLKYFLLMRTPELILTAIERNPRRNLVTAIIAYEIARLRKRCNIALYAKGLPRGDVRRMQMHWAADPQGSVDSALRSSTSGARVVVMPKAAVSMPVPSGA
jgi:nickel-dependent lactate racemase